MVRSGSIIAIFLVSLPSFDIDEDRWGYDGGGNDGDDGTTQISGLEEQHTGTGQTVQQSSLASLILSFIHDRRNQQENRHEAWLLVKHTFREPFPFSVIAVGARRLLWLSKW